MLGWTLVGYCEGLRGGLNLSNARLTSVNVSLCWKLNEISDIKSLGENKNAVAFVKSTPTAYCEMNQGHPTTVNV